MRRLSAYILLAVLFAGYGLPADARGDRKPKAQRDTLYSDTYLDTVNVNRVFQLNDYVVPHQVTETLPSGKTRTKYWQERFPIATMGNKPAEQQNP